jgi:hypothetical protein
MAKPSQGCRTSQIIYIQIKFKLQKKYIKLCYKGQGLGFNKIGITIIIQCNSPIIKIQWTDVNHTIHNNKHTTGYWKELMNVGVELQEIILIWTEFRYLQ